MEGMLLLGHSILVLVENRGSDLTHFPDGRGTHGQTERVELATDHDDLWNTYKRVRLHAFCLAR